MKDEYIFLGNDTFNDPNRTIIERKSFNNDNEFYAYSLSIINERINKMKNVGIYDYKECINCDISEIARLEPIIINPDNLGKDIEFSKFNQYLHNEIKILSNFELEDFGITIW